METVTTRIPEEDEKLLEQMEEEQGAGRSEVLRRIIEKGLEDWRRERALELLEDRKVSVRKAAEIAGLDYVEMLELASREGVETAYTSEDLDKDLAGL